MKNVSHSSRAGWFGGMLSDSNAYQSVSTSGCRTRVNPMRSKILVISRIACETICRCHFGGRIPGAVTSSHSFSVVSLGRLDCIASNISRLYSFIAMPVFCFSS